MAEQAGNLPVRSLGTQGLKVSAIGLGAMGMTMAYGDPFRSRVPVPRAP